MIFEIADSQVPESFKIHRDCVSPAAIKMLEERRKLILERAPAREYSMDRLAYMSNFVKALNQTVRPCPALNSLNRYVREMRKEVLEKKLDELRADFELVKESLRIQKLAELKASLRLEKLKLIQETQRRRPDPSRPILSEARERAVSKSVQQIAADVGGRSEESCYASLGIARF
jgi:hypothetical protein